MPAMQPNASFKFNTFEEVKSHSSVLYNERMAILFYLLDMKSITLNTSSNINDLLEVKAILKQIYKNIRNLLYFNPLCRATLNLETKDEGIYVTDVMAGMLDRMVEYCERQGYTTKSMQIIIYELNNFEMVLKNVLQYFAYFIRPDFKQKPDLEIATHSYKELADKRTIEELRAIVGKNNLIDFENLGVNKIEFTETKQLEKEDDDLDLLGEDEDEGETK